VSTSRTILQILVPLAILGGGAALSVYIADKAPKPATAAALDTRPRVRLAPVTRTDVDLVVRSQGNVEALRTAELSAEVAGRIVSTSPQLRAGGAFAAGDELLQLDRSDFELAIVQQEAAVARAELRLLQEQAEAEAAERAWRELEGERPADPLVRRAPQIRDAEAELAAARALLQKRKLDLQRTRIVAPFAGRVQSVAADLGQTVQPGQRLATLFDTSAIEVRLPLPLEDAAFVDLPLAGDAPANGGPEVVLTAEYGDRTHTWRGRIVRVGGEVDRRTRQLQAVARIEPADAAPTSERPPLMVGMFVVATIGGRTVRDAMVVPRSAMHGEDAVWVATMEVVDGKAQRTLHRRRVEVLRVEHDRVLLRDGVAVGDSVCVTALDSATDGMRVRVVDAQGNEQVR
jgi:RND family efflux transporter MFP subunit